MESPIPDREGGNMEKHSYFLGKRKNQNESRRVQPMFLLIYKEKKLETERNALI